MFFSFVICFIFVRTLLIESFRFAYLKRVTLPQTPTDQPIQPMKFQFKHPQTKKPLRVTNYPSTIWNARYYLDLWDNTIPDENIKVLGQFAQLETSVCSLYLKYDSTYELYSNKRTDEYLKTNKLLTKQHKNLSKMVKTIAKNAGTRKSHVSGWKLTDEQITIVKNMYKTEEAKCQQHTQKTKRKPSAHSRKRR